MSLNCLSVMIVFLVADNTLVETQDGEVEAVDGLIIKPLSHAHLMLVVITSFTCRYRMPL